MKINIYAPLIITKLAILIAGFIACVTALFIKAIDFVSQEEEYFFSKTGKEVMDRVELF